MSIPKTAVKSPNAPAPPPVLSQAIVMGDYVFCSGQIGSNPETGALVQGSIQDRTVRYTPRLPYASWNPPDQTIRGRQQLLTHPQRQILSNLRAVLESAGTSLDNVVKCNIFLTSMSDFSAVNEVYTTFFSAPMPVGST
jgi:enamine deaminase RidA (YjgF/YER057c/UK114 family)